MKKHPYYDSDRRRATEEFAFKTIGWCIASLVILGVIMLIIE
jgi:hypothetical protein